MKVFDFDLNSGTLSNGRKLVEIDKEEGSPDGMTIDAEDNLWIALYGGAAVVCHNSEDGRRLAKLELPAPNITSCAFGGEKLNELYVTSARQGMQPADLEKFPRSGSVFKVNVPVKGVVGNYFKPVR